LGKLKIKEKDDVSKNPLVAFIQELSSYGIHVADDELIYTVMAVLIANWLNPNKPVWMMLVGPAGSGKSLALSLLQHLPEANSRQPFGVKRLCQIKTVAALLSGTPARDKVSGSSGGVLAEIQRGMIYWPDFTECLSMNQDYFKELMGALRQVYDGVWTRDVGSDGGKHIEWKGHIGMLAACTNEIDSHSAALQRLGERWIYRRMRPSSGWQESMAAISGSGDFKAAKDAFAAVMARIGLDYRAGRLDEDVVPLAVQEQDRLIDYAKWTALMRSSVSRDSKTRDITHVGAPEQPQRVSTQLGSMLQACKYMELPDSLSWNIVRTIARDSVPQAKRYMIEYMENRQNREADNSNDDLWYSYDELTKVSRVGPSIMKMLLEEMEYFKIIATGKSRLNGINIKLLLEERT